MKKSLSIFLLIAISINLNAQNTKLTPELLWQLGRISEPVASPDGKTVVFGVRNFDLQADKGNTALYSIQISGGEAKKLTDFKGSEVNARWRPDGKKIGFLCSESGSSQLWEMNPDGTDKKQISTFNYEISNFNYSPTGNHIYYTSEIQIDKTTKDIYTDLPKSSGRIFDGLNYRHWNTWEDGAYSHVFYAEYNNGVIGKAVDIMEGEAFDAPLMPMGGEEQLNWSFDGKKIAYTCKKLSGTEYAVSTNADIYIYTLSTGKTENISQGMLGYDTEPRFSPDGSSILWLSMERPGFEADRNRVFQYNFTTKTKNDLTKGFDQSVGNVIWDTDGKLFYFQSDIRATTQLYSFNFNPKKGAAAIKMITEGAHDYTGFTLAKDSKNTWLIGGRMSISSPVELFTVNASSGVQKPLSFINKPLLSTIKMGKVEKRMIKTTDGKDMLTWVIYPPDFDPAKKYPTLLYCQGGPQSTVSQFFSYRWNFQLMAANGYIVVAPNRRGLPSFGQEWNDAISGDWGGQAINDYLSAIDEVAKEPYVNKEKLGCVGASYGGFSVYYLAGKHNKRFKTFIAHCGLFNLESWYGSTEEMFFANFDMQGPYWNNPQPKSYEAFSPHKFVKNWDAPMLVIHNELDFRVPVTQGMEAFNAAQLQGIPSRFLYFPNEGHWVQKPQNSILWQRVFFDWLERSLK